MVIDLRISFKAKKVLDATIIPPPQTINLSHFGFSCAIPTNIYIWIFLHRLNVVSTTICADRSGIRPAVL
jgi:hypothetical protein